MHQPSQSFSTFEVSLAPEPPCLFVDLRGELDLHSARQVPMEAYRGQAELTTVLIGLSELTFCDVAGLSALLTFCRLHEAQGRTVAISGASPFIRRLMRLCGVSHRLDAVQAAGAALV